MEQLNVPSSYNELMEFASKYDGYIKPDISDILRKFSLSNSPLTAAAPMFYIVDYTKQQYLFVDPSIDKSLGYDSEMIKHAGPRFFTSLWHPNDYKIFNEKILPEAMQFLKRTDINDFHNYAFTFNYRIKTSEGNYVTLLQRSTYFIASNSGLPLAAFGFAVNITHYKETSSIIHTIEKIDPHFNIISKTPVLKSVYYPDIKNTVLTEREIEILHLLHKGFSSKQISQDLGISMNTVSNHRKNMLRKTSTNNTAELITYSGNNNLI